MILAVFASACVGPQAPAPRDGPSAQADRPAQVRRITTAISSADPPIFRSTAGGPFGGSAAGIDSLEELIHAGTAIRDNADTLRPQLAESVPSLENGLWRLLPDGRMETTWKIKQNARWQDGTPFTADDLVFTIRLGQDKELVALGGHIAFDDIESISASDARTAIVRWKRPFIFADKLFTTEITMPLPKHLLERAYVEDKPNLLNLAYWNREFIGAGPFKLRDWLEGSYLVLQAFDQYVLGRPNIDEIVVKFMPDSNALMANILAGEIDINLGRGPSLDQGIQVRDQWRDGRLDVGLVNWILLYPQFIDPRPAVIGDARFRRALMHALDRQEMADSLMWGLVPLADSIVNTRLPQFQAIDSRVVRYEYDPRRAVQMIEALGYTRGADGIFRDSAGQRLSVEIRATEEQEIQVKVMLAAAAYWQRAGVPTETVVIPFQRRRDREYRASRPGFESIRNPDGDRGIARAHSSTTALAENNFEKSGNNARYINPEFDALIDRYFATIPTRERLEVVGDIVHHSTDLLTAMGLFRAANPTLVANRLQRVTPRGNEGTEVWNAHEWEVR